MFAFEYVNVCVWLRYVDDCFVFFSLFIRMLFSVSFPLYAVVTRFHFGSSFSNSSIWSFFLLLLFLIGFALPFCVPLQKYMAAFFLLLLKWKLSTMICKVGLFILFLFRCLFFLLPFLLFLRRLFILVFLSRARSMNVFVCLFRESNHNSICLSHTHKHFINVYNCLWLCDSSANVCLRMCG